MNISLAACRRGTVLLCRGTVSIVVLTLSLLLAFVRLDAQCEFVRGDMVNLSDSGLGIVDANDAVFLLGYLFLGTAGSIPACPDAADANDNGFVEIGDYLYLIRFLFHDGPPPPAPFPDSGTDSTPDVSVAEERDSRFRYKIGSAIGFPSNTGLEIPLTISNEIGIEGMQMVLEYDGNSVRVDEFRLENTVLEEFADNSYIIYQFFNRAGTSHVGLSAILDWEPPLSGATIAAGEDQLAAIMVVAIQLTAEPSQVTRMRFVDGVKFPGAVPEDQLAVVHNFVVFGDEVVRPVLDDNGGVVEIKPAFIRGDANQDRGVDISDSVFLLSYLFYGGTAPACDDAADANNDAGIDLADPIFVLNYLFQGAAQPPAPYPAPGLDPEINNPNDTLDCGI